jgi:hypothetical protein
MEKKENLNEVDNSTIIKNETDAIVNNELLLSLEGWLKYMEGFTKGIGSSEKVSSSLVLECITEVLEYMTVLKKDLRVLLFHCESILKENEKLKSDIELLPIIEIKEGEDDE